MSQYRVRAFLNYVHGTGTAPRLAEQHPTTEAHGPHPTLKPVFRRHPDWKRRLKRMYREERG